MKSPNPHFCLFYLVIARLLAKLTPPGFNGSQTKMKSKIDGHYRALLLQVRGCNGPTYSMEVFPLTLLSFEKTGQSSVILC